MSNPASFEETKTISNKLSDYDLVIINLMGATNKVNKNYGVSQQSLLMANSIAKKSKVILNVFANPYSLHKAPICIPSRASYSKYARTFMFSNFVVMKIRKIELHLNIMLLNMNVCSVQIPVYFPAVTLRYN